MKLSKKIFYRNYHHTFVLAISILILLSCKSENPEQTAITPQKLTVDSAFTVIRLEGEASWLRSSGDSAKPLRNGMRLAVGNVVRTYTESLIELRTVSGTSFVLQEESQLELVAWSNSGQPVHGKVLLAMGTLAFSIQKLGSGAKLEMHTPTATAAVRGTRGELETSGTGTVVHLEEGELDLTHAGSKNVQKLQAGQVALQNERNFETTKAPPGRLREVVNEKRLRMWNLRDRPVIPGIQLPSNKELRNLYERRQLRHQKIMEELQKNKNDLGRQKGTAQKEFSQQVNKLQKAQQESVKQKEQVQNTAKQLRKQAENIRKQNENVVRKAREQTPKKPDQKTINDAKKRFGL